MSDYRHPEVSLRQLQYALAVREEGTVGAAARACGVSQPALSAQLAKLEAALGHALFERGARATRVTQAGHRLLQYAERTLTAARELEEAARSLSDPGAIVLRVGLIPTVAPYLLPHLVRRLRTPGDPPRVHWLELQTEDAEEALSSGGVDAILIADPPLGSRRVDRVLGWEPFVAVTPREEPGDGPLPLADLTSQPLLLLDRGHCLRDQTLTLCGDRTVAVSPYRGTSLATVVQMVAMGLGVSLLPATAAPLEAGRAAVRTRPLRDPDAGRTLRLVWRASSPHGDRLERLAEAAAGALSDALAAPLRES